MRTGRGRGEEGEKKRKTKSVARDRFFDQRRNRRKRRLFGCRKKGKKKNVRHPGYGALSNAEYALPTARAPSSRTPTKRGPM